MEVATGLLVLAVLALMVGMVSYHSRRRTDQSPTPAILTLIVGADLLVFAVNATVV